MQPLNWVRSGSETGPPRGVLSVGVFVADKREVTSRRLESRLKDVNRKTLSFLCMVQMS